MDDLQEEFQFDESFKELLAGLTILATAPIATYKLHQVLNDRPEPIEDKIAALDRVQDKNGVTPEFDKAAEELKKYYVNTVRRLPKSQDSNTPELKQPERFNPQAKSDSEKTGEMPKLVKPRKFYPDGGISDELIETVKKYEGFYPERYWDHKQWSIGYGSKAKPGEKTITKEEAERRLKEALEKHRNAVLNAKKKWGYDWTDEQVDALTSFRYNVGNIGQLTQNGKRSNEEIANMMPKYNKASGKTSSGLTKRRMSERQMFTSGG